MAARNWYCNREWSSEIEARFFENLRRAKLKADYSRNQAKFLARRYPEVALKLLKECFRGADNHAIARAFAIEAKAHLSLGNVEQAVKSYTKALDRERGYPNVGTAVALEFATLVATRKIKPHYNAALEALEQRKSLLVFPVDEFRYHALRSIIYKEQFKLQAALESARDALRAAEKTDSGFGRASRPGVVENIYEDLKSQVRRLVAG